MHSAAVQEGREQRRNTGQISAEPPSPDPTLVPPEGVDSNADTDVLSQAAALDADDRSCIPSNDLVSSVGACVPNSNCAMPPRADSRTDIDQLGVSW